MAAGRRLSDEAEAPTTAPGIDLRAEVLTINDLPVGWSIDNSDDEDEDSADCFEQVDDLDTTATAKADASFQKSDTEFLGSGVAYFDQAGVADQSFDKVLQAFRACREIDEDGIKGTAGETSFKEFGDRSNAFTINAESDGSVSNSST